jgi:hypothetical protein
MMLLMFLSINLRWRNSEVLLAGDWLIKQELLTTEFGLTHVGIVPEHHDFSKQIA